MSALNRKCEAPACRVPALLLFEKGAQYAHALCFVHGVQLAGLAWAHDPTGRTFPTWWDAAEWMLAPIAAPRRAVGRPATAVSP